MRALFSMNSMISWSRMISLWAYGFSIITWQTFQRHFIRGTTPTLHMRWHLTRARPKAFSVGTHSIWPYHWNTDLLLCCDVCCAVFIFYTVVQFVGVKHVASFVSRISRKQLWKIVDLMKTETMKCFILLFSGNWVFAWSTWEWIHNSLQWNYTNKKIIAMNAMNSKCGA